MSVTGKQRCWAMSVGLIIRDISISREQYEKLVGDVKANWKKTRVANKTQRELAKHWDIEIKPTTSGWIASEQLYDFIKIKVFIFSVFRKLSDAKWQCFVESGLDEDIVEDIAKRIYQNQNLKRNLLSLGELTGSTSSDAWYRMAKKQTDSEAFKFISEALQESLGVSGRKVSRQTKRNKSQRTKVTADSFPDISISDTRTRGRVRKPSRRTKKTGCAVMFLIFFAITLLMTIIGSL